MRPIKFRVWDKSLEEMRYSINIPSDYTERNGSLDLINMFQMLNQRYVFMQYTGLKDKNNRKIYEGDVLKNDNGDLWVVVWKGTGFMLALNGESKNIYSANEYYFSSCEVIGNIYAYEVQSKEGGQ